MAEPAVNHDHDRCIDAALARAADLCARRGARLTAQRRRVLELVWSGHSAVKAYDLLDELGRGAASAKPPTVYRALDFLIAHGLVHRLESMNAYVGCPDPDGRHEGQFLICDDCGLVRELRAPRLERAIAAQAADAGFAVTQQTVEVRGTCRSCRASPPNLS
jgi:Fur family transcriptional regulator, zinc uptake regulator